MPVYRITRLVVTDAIEVDAPSPQEAIALIAKSGITVKSEFAETRVEEVIPPPAIGYREVRSDDVLSAVKASRADAGDVK